MYFENVKFSIIFSQICNGQSYLKILITYFVWYKNYLTG